MPIQSEALPEHGLLVFRHVGTVSDEEFVGFYEWLYDKREKRYGVNQLVDLRDADSAPRSVEALRKVSQLAKGCIQGDKRELKVAVVAPRDLAFGLARMYEAYSGDIPWQFVVFRDPEAALAWLGVPEDVMRRLIDDMSE